MIAPIKNQTASSLLAASLAELPGAPAGAANSFENQLKSALEESLGKDGGVLANARLSVSKEAGEGAPGTPAGSRFVVTVEIPPQAAASSSSEPPANQKAAAAQPAAAAAPAVVNKDAVTILREQLSAMGIASNQMRFERWDEVINNVGGNYVNRLIRVDIGNGISEDFCATGTMQKPYITATEILRLQKMGNVVA